MKNLLRAALALLLFTVCAAAQTNSPAVQPSPSPSPAIAEVKKRPPVFRANKDQISQAQIILKQKNLY